MNMDEHGLPMATPCYRPRVKMSTGETGEASEGVFLLAHFGASCGPGDGRSKMDGVSFPDPL